MDGSEGARRALLGAARRRRPLDGAAGAGLTSGSPAGLRRFSVLLGAPGVRTVVLAGIVGRLPVGMNALGLVLLVRGGGESYAVAGGVAAVYSIAIAVSQPVLGRLVDRHGQRRVLAPLGLAFPAALGGVVVAAGRGASPVVLGAGAAVAGLLLPPLGASIRALWAEVLAAPELRSTAFALEAVLQEVQFVIGPLLAALLAGTVSPAAAVLAAAACGAVGTLVFAATPAAGAAGGAGESRAPGLGALASPGIRVIVVAALGMGASFGTIEVGAPAFAEAHGAARASGGVALAAFSLGSLLGGLWVGTRDEPRSAGGRLRVALVAYAAGLAGPALLAGSLPAVVVLLLVAGVPIAPAFAAAYGLVDDLAPAGTTTEAFAWISTAVVCGLAAGSAASGALAELAGVSVALGAAAAFAACAALAVTAGRERLSAPAAAPALSARRLARTSRSRGR